MCVRIIYFSGVHYKVTPHFIHCNKLVISKSPYQTIGIVPDKTNFIDESDQEVHV